MGGHQVKICDNCKHKDLHPSASPCYECIYDGEGFNGWQSNRGRTKGSKSKPGSKKPGPKTKPSGELMCFTVISTTKNDLKAYGGPDKLKADVKLMVDKEINKS